ncbi:MAG: dUTP diphosphatase [Acutalibacter sp.]|nr:dUTP diphosphatase [Acutalibacter sp.]
MEEKVLKIKLLREGAALPCRETAGSAGFDLRACLEIPLLVEPGEWAMVPTGLGAEIPQGMAGMVFSRSGLGTKSGMVVAQGVGVIDSDYRGEIKVPLRNMGKKAYEIQPGERVAQLVLLPVCLPPVEEAQALSATQRGEGGFGSTGK